MTSGLPCEIITPQIPPDYRDFADSFILPLADAAQLVAVFEQDERLVHLTAPGCQMLHFDRVRGNLVEGEGWISGLMQMPIGDYLEGQGESGGVFSVDFCSNARPSLEDYVHEVEFRAVRANEDGKRKARKMLGKLIGAYATQVLDFSRRGFSANGLDELDEAWRPVLSFAGKIVTEVVDNETGVVVFLAGEYGDGRIQYELFRAFREYEADVPNSGASVYLSLL